MLFVANVAVEQEVIVTAIMIALFIFKRFCCMPAQVESKPSSDFALRQWPEVGHVSTFSLEKFGKQQVDANKKFWPKTIKNNTTV